MMYSRLIPTRSIRGTLLLWLLLLSLLPLLINAYINSSATRDNLEENIVQELISRSQNKSEFVLNWFHYRFHDTSELTKAEHIIGSISNLQAAFALANKPVSEFIHSYQWEKAVNPFRPALYDSWLSSDYIYDIFLIDNQGNILFTLAEEDDLGTNLKDGKYANTKFAHTALRSYETGDTLFSDLESYSPSNDGIFGFITSPILTNDGHKLGTLAIQIKLNRLSHILFDNDKSQDYSYVISEHGQFRTIHDDRNNKPNLVNLALNQTRQAFFHRSDSKATAYKVVGKYQQEVIALHLPIMVGDIPWVVVSEVDAKHAFQLVTKQTNATLVLLIFTMVVVVIVALVLSSNLIKPLLTLVKVVEKAEKDNFDTNFKLQSKNELGVLANGLRRMFIKHKIYQDELQSSVSFQKAVLQNLGQALVIINQKGLIKEFTPKTTSLFGYTRDDIIGKSINTLMPEGFASHHDNYLKQHVPTSKENIIGKNRDLKGLKKDGSEFDMELVVTSMEINGEILFMGLISDVSERIKLQTELLEALTKAGDANRAKSDFLANMSHEIRTPMNGIYGTLQLLNNSEQNEENKELLSRALYSSRSLLTIINDILDFSKIEAGKLEIEDISFNANEIIHQVVSVLNPSASEKSIPFNFNIDDDFADGWFGDPVRIHQVLLNISSNAVKFTHQGSVNIYLSNLIIEEELRGIILTVEDTGIGMSQDAVQRLFERFDQADTSTTRLFGGTGLGMAITKCLVDLMHGSIHVESEQGKGTRFEVILPLKRDHSATVHVRSENLSTTPDYTGKTILLAEDNKINQVIFRTMMNATNANIVIVENGQEAVEILSDQPLPDLIYMDIQMPVMDGIEACRIIKQQHPELNIIALTANVMASDVSKYQEAGFDAHIGKPIEMQTLYQVSDRFLGSSYSGE